MNKPVCLILGAGAGIGGNVAKRLPEMAIMHVWHAAATRVGSTNWSLKLKSTVARLVASSLMR